MDYRYRQQYNNQDEGSSSMNLEIENQILYNGQADMEGSERYRHIWNDKMQESKNDSSCCSTVSKLLGVLSIIVGVLGIIIDTLVFNSRLYSNINDHIMVMANSAKENVLNYSNFEAKINGGEVTVKFSDSSAYLYTIFTVVLQLGLIVIGIMLVRSGGIGQKVLREKLL